MTLKKEKILITGSTGLAGSYLYPLIDSQLYEMYTTSHTAAPHAGILVPLDFMNLQSISETLSKVMPDVIINLAAMTDVDGCETRPQEADMINHRAILEIVKYLERNKECYLVHVSTDYVFDGTQGNYTEESVPSPVNWYGKTKLRAEQELTSCNSTNWCIARTSTPFGIHEKKESFPLFVIRNLLNNKEIRVLKDQVTSPTYALNLAEMLYEIACKKLTGIIHTAGDSQISRFDQALQIADVKGLDSRLIKPVTLDQMNWKARRPANSALNVDKAKSILDHKPMSFHESIVAFVKEQERA